MELSELHALAILPLGKNPDAQQIGGWVDPTAHLEVLEKIWVPCPCQIQTQDHPAHSLFTAEHWHSHHNSLVAPWILHVVTQSQTSPCGLCATNAGF